MSINEDNYQRWLDGVTRSGSKAHLLAHIRSLSHRRGRTIEANYPMRGLAEESGEYFSALRDIHSLTLCNIQVEHISEDQFRTCFSAFRETLTHLSLETVTTSIGAFVTLVDYFPNITTLQLRSLVLEHDKKSTPPLSRPFRGNVRVHCFRGDRMEFFDQFVKLDLEYEELVIASRALFIHEKIEFLDTVLQISVGTIRFLRLVTELDCEHPLPDLSKPHPHPTLPRKTELHRRSTTSGNSKSWNC